MDSEQPEESPDVLLIISDIVSRLMFKKIEFCHPKDGCKNVHIQLEGTRFRCSRRADVQRLIKKYQFFLLKSKTTTLSLDVW